MFSEFPPFLGLKLDDLDDHGESPCSRLLQVTPEHSCRRQKGWARENWSLITRIYIKRSGMEVHACNPSMGRQTVHLGLSDFLKKKNKTKTRWVTQRLTSDLHIHTQIQAHRHTQIYIHTL